MKLRSAAEFLLATTLFGVVVNTNPLQADHISALRRALSNSPSGGYAPGQVKCPTDKPFIRSAQDISDGEHNFVKKRHVVTDAALKDFMNRAGMVGFDIDTFFNSYSPTVGIAFSGGGYRAMLSGAGAVKAMDSRTPGTNKTGQVGGLLQGATYMAGLSGGSWLLGSIVINNFTTISALQSSRDIWDLNESILFPDSLSYYRNIRDQVDSKGAAGFETTLTDYWGRALSHQFIDWDQGGPGVTFSSIALTDAYKNAEMPFPIIVADARNPGEILISKNTTVFEFNPLEFGSFDPSLFAFTPTETMGTNLTKGVPTNKDVCIRGFDNAGYIMGTSSSLFNQIIFQIDGQATGVKGLINQVVKDLLTKLSESEMDIADYTPNPFYGVNPEINPSAKTQNLTLVDGGEDLQNVPFHPLIQPTRKLDVIFAFDNSADTLNRDGSTSNWPNGTAIVATYERAMDSEIGNGTLFPHVPDVNTFVNLGLNKRPTFFGCNGTNITAGHPNAVVPPLVVYIPNSPWTYPSNASTLQMDYSYEERDAIIANGFNIASQGNGTLGSGWPACVSCAIVYRHLERTGMAQSDQCKKCFSDYCWNGTIDARLPAEYKPALYLRSGVGRAVARLGAVFLAVAVAGLVSVV